MLKCIQKMRVRMRRKRMVRANTHSKFNPDAVMWRLNSYTATSDNMRRHCLRIIMSEYIDSINDAAPLVNQVYDRGTKSILDQVQQYYQHKIYAFRNIKYSANELQNVVIGFALGRLPLGFFKYYDGFRYVSTVPHCPVEGAEIVTMPNYETFAVYNNGVWELNVDIVQANANYVPVTSRIVPYIAGTHTVTCYYEASVDVIPHNVYENIGGFESI